MLDRLLARRDFASTWAGSSSMTCGAVGRRIDAALFAQLSSVGDRVTRSSPIHVGHLGRWAEMFFGSTVAVEAPAHAERLLLGNLLHAVDAPVAGHAADATRDVGAVVEEDVVRQIVHLDPLDRGAGGVALANGQELRAVFAHQPVTVHASLGWRNRRVTRLIHRVVAVATVDPELAGVQRVAVRNGLLGLVAHIRRLRGKPVPNECGQVDGSSAERSSRELPDLVGPAGEDEHLHRAGSLLIGWPSAGQDSSFQGPGLANPAGALSTCEGVSPW